MIATIKLNSKSYQFDLSKPIDISIPISATKSNVNAWYIGQPRIEPEEFEGFTAAVDKGACINFNNIYFNPHGHGTHTECAGHITSKVHSVNENLNQYFFFAELVTVGPTIQDGDFVISKKQLQFALGNKKREAIVIRTLPNTKEKLSKQYSYTNPPYLLEEAAIYLKEKGIKHLLIDLPSVDREKDEGLLLSHNAFWNTKGKLRLDATITELIFVPNNIDDGSYLLDIQMAPFENDASPSRPVLYKLED